MKKHSDVRWSEVARRAIAEHLEKIGETSEGMLPASELRMRLKKKGLDVTEVSLEKAIRHYGKMRELEWRRTSTTRTS